MTTMFRTECSGRSKYFENIAAAFRHFHKCIAQRKSVEIWLIEAAAVQKLIDSAYFH